MAERMAANLAARKVEWKADQKAESLAGKWAALTADC